MYYLGLQAYHLLSSTQKKRGLWIVFFVAIGSLLDFFSLAFFLPIVFLLINPQKTMANEQFMDKFPLFRAIDPMHLGLGITVIAVIFIAIKTRVNIWVTYQKANYAYGIARNLASRALTRYFKSSYTQFADTDFTKEMNRISNLPLTFANNVVIPGGTLLSEIIVLSLLLTAIALYNIHVFLFMALIIAPVAIIYSWKRKNIGGLTTHIKKVYPRLLKYALQSVEALPEIRIFRKESFFKDRFNSTYSELGKMLAKDHTAHTTASRSTELVAGLSIGALIGYALVSKLPYNETLILLSIYAGVSFRAIPSVNRIFAASLQIRSNDYVIQDLSEIVAPSEDDFNETPAALPFQEKFELCNISFGYDANSMIIKNASLAVKKGDKIILTGKSGTGKTTLLHLLLRFVKEQLGDIRVDGVKLTDHNTKAWEKLIGYVSQNPYILDGSITENIAFGIPEAKINPEKINNLIHVMGLASWVNTLPEKSNTLIGERGTKISGGQRQRIAIARALYHDAEILLLDEITNQLDRQTELEVMAALDNFAFMNKTIILITHWPELWESFSSVYQFKNGNFEKQSRGALNQVPENVK
jgi:ATP-binding cassette, subfamily B, bacterial PglK